MGVWCDRPYIGVNDRALFLELKSSAPHIDSFVYNQQRKR